MFVQLLRPRTCAWQLIACRIVLLSCVGHQGVSAQHGQAQIPTGQTPQPRMEALINQDLRRKTAGEETGRDFGREAPAVRRNAGRRLTGLDSAVDCSGSPGFDEQWPLVGAQAHEALQGESHPAYNSGEPLQVTNGCRFHYHMFKGDRIHVEVVRPTTTSILWVEWNHDVAFPVALMSWAAHGLPVFEPFGQVNFDFYIWDFGLQGDVVYRSHPDGYDLFHCNRGCSSYTSQQHAGETGGKFLITLDTQFEGNDQTVFTGSWRFYFKETSNAMKLPQFVALKQFYLEACSPYRNNTPSWAPWVTDWSWALHYTFIFKDPDAKPFCDWLQSTGWENTTISAIDDPVRGPCSSLEHVLCDDDGNVVIIDLHTAGMRGTLPEVLGSLTALQRLRLPYNQFVGTLPKEVLQLSSLTEVVLHHNHFQGEVPCFASSELQDLFIDWNYWSGTVPECLANNQLLEHFSSDHSRLVGTLPAALGQLTKLQTLSVGGNRITGGIPAGLCHLPALRRVDLSNNKLGGRLPIDCFTSALRLAHLRLNYNLFSGTLPRIGDAMIQLKELDLSHNKLEGGISNQLEVIKANSVPWIHSEVHLNDNRFSGELPVAIYSLVIGAYNITSLTVNDNKFRCQQNGGWPEWAMRLKKEFSKKLGKCVPVPRPLEVSPTWGYPGEQFVVSGENFVPQEPRCRLQGQDESLQSVPGMYLSERQVQCFVPSGLASGKYSITASNFGMDFATPAIFPDLKVNMFTVIDAPKLLAESPRVTMKVLFIGIHREDLVEPEFREVIAGHLAKEASSVIIDEVVATTWMNSTGGSDSGASDNPETATAKDAVEIAFTVQVTDGYEAQRVQSLLAWYKQEEFFTGYFDEYYPSVKVIVTSGPDTEAVRIVDAVQENKVLSGWAIVGIIFLVLTACLCGGFTYWVVRREKKGNPYFYEECEEEIMAEVNSRTFSVAPAPPVQSHSNRTNATRVVAPKRSQSGEAFSSIALGKPSWPGLD